MEVRSSLRHAPCRVPRRGRVSQDNDLAIQGNVVRGRASAASANVRGRSGLSETPYLLSIPKVAPVTAAVFLGSIGDPRAYEAGEQILRVAGLSLIERSSGVLRGSKRISKRGRPLLRAAAYMFAVRSITKGSLSRAEYEALCQRNGGVKMKAVVAVMRSGLRLLYSIARDRRPFTTEAPARRRAAA